MFFYDDHPDKYPDHDEADAEDGGFPALIERAVVGAAVALIACSVVLLGWAYKTGTVPWR